CNLDVLGHPRTYARLEAGQEFSYKNWVEAVRAGRTFVTNGPMLFLTVNAQDPGGVIDLPAGTTPVPVRAEARSLAPSDHLEVVANGRVVGRVDATGDPASALLDADVPLPEGGWLVARCWGPYDDAMEQWTAAQTSPVYVRSEGRVPAPDPAALATFVGHLDEMLQWVDREGRFEDDRQRRRLAGVFERAREALFQRGAAAGGPRGG